MKDLLFQGSKGSGEINKPKYKNLTNIISIVGCQKTKVSKFKAVLSNVSFHNVYCFAIVVNFLTAYWRQVAFSDASSLFVCFVRSYKPGQVPQSGKDPWICLRWWSATAVKQLSTWLVEKRITIVKRKRWRFKNKTLLV